MMSQLVKTNMNRGNVEDTLKMVRDTLTAENIGYDADGYTIRNICYILKWVIHILIENQVFQIFPVHESNMAFLFPGLLCI